MMPSEVIRLSMVSVAPPISLSIFGAESGGALFENGRYEYELDSSGFSLREVPGVIRHSRILQACERGTIEPGNYVGLLKLALVEKGSGTAVAETHVDVRSRKLGYEDEYRSMLEDLADRCSDFLLQLESPVEQRFLPEDTEHEPTLAQRLYFLKSLLGGEAFQTALQRILAMPNTRWREEHRFRDVRNSKRLGRHELRQFASASRRVPVPEGHALAAVLASVPEQIETRDKRDTVDTPENRFVKHALTVFTQCLEDLLTRFRSLQCRQYPGLVSEIEALTEDLEEVLAHEVFKQVSPPGLLPLNSPVLQRKEGYRQVLRAWMLFELAARLSWEGGDDVYAGGKRDAAALYEYWVFFKLLDLVAGLFDLKQPPVESLIHQSDLVLKLKAGKYLPIEGTYSGAGRRLNIEFSYNRTFSAGDRPYPKSGSWSRQMRPDYTLSLWPADFSREEAEIQELITHVHFDAKYKVDSLEKLFGKEDAPEEELSVEKAAERKGTYQRADLLKMHAYRDAIRRSAGAYVLYPGRMDRETRMHGFHELLPGLGAFPLRPDATDDGTAALTRFLKEIVAHVCNRASQREQQTYHTYRIHKGLPANVVRESLQEGDEGYRCKPLSETYVLHGWINSPEHLHWVKSSGLYNYRTEDRRGSLRLKESVAGAAYLYLHGSGEYGGGGTLFRIVSDGPRVFSSERLVEKGYRGNASQPYYLVFELKGLSEADPLSGYDWDLSKIGGIGEARASALPERGIPLSEFMKGAKPKGGPGGRL
jgi:predicted component of viral defense system (DUF524 family)